jgi:hypothetical protein
VVNDDKDLIMSSKEGRRVQHVNTNTEPAVSEGDAELVFEHHGHHSLAPVQVFKDQLFAIESTKSRTFQVLPNLIRTFPIKSTETGP